MQYFEVVRVFIFSLVLGGLFCTDNDLARLKGRVKHLETRLNYQVSLRDEEYAELTDRLDDIDNIFNVSVVAQGQPKISETIELSNLDHEVVGLLKEDFARIRKSFREEKTETERFRREIPKIENNLISIHEEVENYCKGALNNTDQLLTSFEGSSASEKRIIAKIESATDDNIMAHEQERRILQDIGEKVQLNNDNEKTLSEQIKNLELMVTTLISKEQLKTENEKIIFEKVANLELLVSNLFSHITLSMYTSSCLELKSHGAVENGIYHLIHGFEVYCDQTTDGGGWTVFQRRINDEVDFYRNWREYKNGFGDLSGEFWLGNDHLSLLTADGNHELRVEMRDFDGNTAYAKYSKFKIYPEEDRYKLEVSGYSGTAGDSLEYHNGMMFSTFDSDNDKRSYNCADAWHGAWWYNGCHYSNLNGQYYNKPGKIDKTGIRWYHWKKNNNYCLKKVEMKFR